MELLDQNIIKQFKKQNLPFIKYGLNKEQEQQEYIKNRYGKDLINTSHFSVFDWENEKTRVEVKNRKCNHNDYSTTMIGYNKIVDGKKDDRDCFFLFGFADGSLWEWKLDKTKEYVPTKRTNFKSKKYTTFNPLKENYYLPMNECEQIIPPLQTQGCLIKIKT